MANIVNQFKKNKQTNKQKTNLNLVIDVFAVFNKVSMSMSALYKFFILAFKLSSCAQHIHGDIMRVNEWMRAS